MPPGIAHSNLPSATLPSMTCSSTQRRAEGATKGGHICFSAAAGKGVTVAASASDGVFPSKPRLPVAVIEPSGVMPSNFSIVTSLPGRSALPETAIRSATSGGASVSRAASTAPRVSNW